MHRAAPERLVNGRRKRYVRTPDRNRFAGEANPPGDGHLLLFPDYFVPGAGPGGQTPSAPASCLPGSAAYMQTEG